MRDVPYIAYESALTHANRANRRLWVIILVLVVALIASNVAWVIYESQFETVEEVTTTTTTYDVAQENGSGDNNYIGRDGDINGQTEN